jgi:hypothetical protein
MSQQLFRAQQWVSGADCLMRLLQAVQQGRSTGILYLGNKYNDDWAREGRYRTMHAGQALGAALSVTSQPYAVAALACAFLLLALYARGSAGM